MSEPEINYQCWICPICGDDHSRPWDYESNWSRCNKDDLAKQLFGKQAKITQLEEKLAIVINLLKVSRARSSYPTKKWNERRDKALPIINKDE